MTIPADHPLRFALANELHARPFPVVPVPSIALFLALKPAEDGPSADRQAGLAHLLHLLDRHGAPHPQPGATHWSGEIGKHRLKWEQHTEFVTYTIFGADLPDRAFDPHAFDLFPRDWLAEAPGLRVTSAMIRFEPRPPVAQLQDRLGQWFVAESLAVADVLDGAATIASDFRIDEGGHMRMAAFVTPGTGERRTGRILQRLTEIETYKTMSMLGLARAREMGPRLAALDAEMGGLMVEMQDTGAEAAHTLARLLAVSAEIEGLSQSAAFRFGATGAYSALVDNRIGALRETRFEGRQTFAEFMARRFDPAMRTVRSTEDRLTRMTAAAARAGELLRTRVDVDRSAQNQKLLESMDTRADLQLRLQQTVEGLSVVAISYYAVSLGAYLLAPLAEAAGLAKTGLQAALVLPVLLVVWLMVRRIRKRLH